MALSDKLNILFPISVDESSLVVTPAAVATLPAEHVFNDRRDKFMRVISTTAIIKFNANELTLISGVGIGNHNLANGSTVRIRAYDDFSQAGAVTYDSTVIILDIDSTMGDLLTQIYYCPFNEVSYKSIQIDISAPGNTQIDIGRIMPGFVFEPSWNYQWGSKWQWIEENGVSYRVFSFDLNELDNTENDRYEFEKMKATKQGDLLLCTQPSATGLERLKNTAICKRANDISRTRHRANTNKHSDKYQEVY